MPSIPRFLLSLTSALTLASALTVSDKRQDVSTQTTFIIDEGCDADQRAILTQANKDALTLANAALDDGRELLSIPGEDGKYINFGTQAALDYWGPPSSNAPYRQRIFDTLYRATQSYRGIGWSDWWSNRYVTQLCTDISNDCGDVNAVAAYNVQNFTAPYPEIVFCPAFFDILVSHGDQVAKIQADKTGQLKRNVRNLRSRATTALHEWLHIKNYTAEVCEGGCLDIWQGIGGGERVRSYKAGRTKLLASRDQSKAAINNDNYAYFAMARFMEKTFGTYPEYPTMWDPTKTQAENLEIEDGQPGAASSIQAWEMDDSQPQETTDNDTEVVTTGVAPSQSYPSWYQPIVAAGATTALPSISVPAETQLAFSAPSRDSVVCETSNGSPAYDDCVNAFGTLDMFADQAAQHGEKGQTWWAGYVESCALAVWYTDDWTDSCKATLGDVQAHASAIFEGCQNGSSGLVGGKVPFAVPNCPAQIEIIHTEGPDPQVGS